MPDQKPLGHGITDADGKLLYYGDRVKVTGSERFEEGEGIVTGYIRQSASYGYSPDPTDPDDPGYKFEEKEMTRIRIRLDNEVDGDNYTASQPRVTRLEKVTADEEINDA